MVSRSTLSRIFSWAALLAVAPVGAQPAPSTTPYKLGTAKTLSIEETVVGSVAGFEPVRQSTDFPFKLYDDTPHIAFIGAHGKDQFVVLDGKSSPAYDWVIPDSLGFSPDGKRLAYLIQTSTDTQPVVDGQAAKGYYSIKHDHVFFSPDSKHVAFVAQYKGGGAAVVADGVVGMRFDDVDLPIFSPDSQRLAYSAVSGKHGCVIVDNTLQKLYTAVGRPVFSPDSKHVTYETILDGKVRLVMDGMEGKPYDGLAAGPVFSADGARLMAIMLQAGKFVIIINGRESAPYEMLVQGDFVSSPDGKRLVYAVKEGNVQYAFVDGVQQPAFEHVAPFSLTFSPDSRHVAYVAGAKKNGPEFVVLDGVGQKEFNGIVGAAFFSPDSKRFAFGTEREKKQRLTIDSVEGRPYDRVELPQFSPDSRRVAYRTALGDKAIAVIDGVDSAPFQRVGLIAFGPDSKHVAYLCIHDDKIWAMIDGSQVGGPYDLNSLVLRVIFDNSTTAHFMAMRKGDFVRVRINLAPENAGSPKAATQNSK